jgi:hypothetical protein
MDILSVTVAMKGWYDSSRVEMEGPDLDNIDLD